jgi:hypothetical protein
MFGAEKIFRRQFTPHEGGYLFYPFVWSRGYLVTEEEFQKLCQDRKRSLGLSGMLRLWALALVLIIVCAAVAIFLEDERLLNAGSIASALAILAVVLWRSTTAIRLVRGRQPVAPTRNRIERERHSARVVGWPMMLVVFLLSVWFLFLSAILAYASPLIGVPILALFGFAFLRNTQVAWRKYAEGIRSP